MCPYTNIIYVWTLWIHARTYILIYTYKVGGRGVFLMSFTGQWESCFSALLKHILFFIFAVHCACVISHVILAYIWYLIISLWISFHCVDLIWKAIDVCVWDARCLLIEFYRIVMFFKEICVSALADSI